MNEIEQKDRILVVRKMSALEYYYNGKHESKAIIESSNGHNKGLQKILDILKESGREFDVVTRKELSKRLVNGYGTIISAGGDGTVIATAAYNVDVPQLNIRTDKRSVGAICQKDIRRALEALLNGRYKIEEWQREDVYLDGKLVGRASNETCVGEKLRFDKLGRYILKFVDAQIGKTIKEEQSGSGIVIATGTGSGAWPAAFKPHPRNSKYFQFRTLLLHSGKIDRGSATYVCIEYKGHEGKYAIDTKVGKLRRDSVLEIKLSEHPLRVIIPE